MLVPFEIDEANLLLVPAANSAAGDSAIAIASAGLLANLNEVLLRLGLRDLIERRDRDVSCRRSERSVDFYWHGKSLGQNDLVALLQRHDGLFPIGRVAGLIGPLTARFAVNVHGVHLHDLHLEQFLHRLAN